MLPVVILCGGFYNLQTAEVHMVWNTTDAEKPSVCGAVLSLVHVYYKVHKYWILSTGVKVFAQRNTHYK